MQNVTAWVVVFFWPYLLWYLSDAVAFGARTGICREMRAARALHYLADGRERVRETERARELRHRLQTPGNIISSMPRAEPIRVPRRAPQTAIISSRNRNAFDTPAPITSERLAGAQRFFFFFFSFLCKGSICAAAAAAAGTKRKAFWRGGLVEPAGRTKHLFTSGLCTPAPADLMFLSAA